MPIILALYASILVLALWQESHGRDSDEQPEEYCC